MEVSLINLCSVAEPRIAALSVFAKEQSRDMLWIL
jgi:hypothetical protein